MTSNLGWLGRGAAMMLWVLCATAGAQATDGAAPSAVPASAPATPLEASSPPPSLPPTVVAPVMRPLWEIGLGAGALCLPDYRGSDQSRTRWFPVPYVVYRGKWLRADREGARAVLLDAQSVEVDLSFAASPPSNSRDNDARAGMPDLKAAVEFGPNVNLTLQRSDDRKLKLDLRLPLRAAFTVQGSPRAIGVNFAPNLNLDLAGVGGGWNVGLLTGPMFADRRYHDRVYGVDPVYATPQRSAYRAGGGYSGWQALAAVSRRFDVWWVGGFVRYDNLRGAAFADSPLLRRDNALTWGFGVSRVLGTSAELVAVPD
jgi:outer membrane scaffolding protein for murein synthesis (MipA/OmpV family)